MQKEKRQISLAEPQICDLQSHSTECVTNSTPSAKGGKHKKIKIEFKGLSSRLKNFLHSRETYRPRTWDSKNGSTQGSFAEQGIDLSFEADANKRDDLETCHLPEKLGNCRRASFEDTITHKSSLGAGGLSKDAGIAHKSFQTTTKVEEMLSDKTLMD